MARQLQCERLSIGATFSILFARDLDFPLQSIFLSLEPVSLKNSRLVCKLWNHFIKHRVWGTKKDSEPNSRLRQRLSYHWIHATPTVKSTVLKSTVLQPDTLVFSLSCDDTVLVCGMVDDHANVYDLASLNLLAVLDCQPPHDDSTYMGVVNVDVGRDVVATGTTKGDVSVWRKADWSNVFKERLHGDCGVWHVKVVANLIITGGRDARLALLSWDGNQVSLMRMIEEEKTFTNFGQNRIVNRITGLDSDGEWLVYGTMKELKVWNLPENKMVHSCDIEVNVQSVAVVLKYPYAVVATYSNSLRVIDLRTGDTVYKSLFNDIDGYCVNLLYHNKTILAGSNRTFGGQNSIYFCDLRQITNPQQNGPHWRRRKLLENVNENDPVRSCVNTSCVVAVQGNELLVWDFWNCDDFSDSPDDF